MCGFSAANIKANPFPINLSLHRIDPGAKLVKTLPAQQQEVYRHQSAGSGLRELLASLWRLVLRDDGKIQIALFPVISPRSRSKQDDFLGIKRRNDAIHQGSKLWRSSPENPLFAQLRASESSPACIE
jgi:hypothetical protein